MDYLGSVTTSLLSTLFFIFAIAMLGYLIGAIKIKGISLGTAGVLLVALLVGVLFSKIPSFSIGETTVTMWNDSIKKIFSIVSNIGTAMFVTAVGLIAGPKFFRSFNKKMLSYLLMGVIVIATGVLLNVIVCVAGGMDFAMGTGLLTGALTSTPGLSAAKEAATAYGEEYANEVTAGYGIGYLYGVLGVVLFVQIMPKILKIDIAKERESFVSAETVKIDVKEKKLFKTDSFGFFPFMFTVVFGIVLGSIQIPLGSWKPFSLTTSGGTLVAGLIVGHFGNFGKLDMKVPKQTLNFFRELGLMLFLIGAGVPGGVNFVNYFNWLYLVYGVIFTTVPMIVGFLLAKYVFKLSIFNNLGSITGGMTSTPALGSLISVAGTDEVASSYAATYPVALVLIVIASNLMVTLGL